MIYFLIANGIYLFLLFMGAIDIGLRRIKKSSHFVKESEFPPVSIIAPAFNMEASILGAVGGILRLDYPDYEVVLVNDGSSDRTLELLKASYELELDPGSLPTGQLMTPQKIRGVYRSVKNPRLRVIDKENARSKADALNAGLSFIRHAHFCAVDADSLLEKNALREIMLPFVLDSEKVVATGGTIRVINGSSFNDGSVEKSRVNRSPIVLFQIVEYLRAFYGGRTGWDFLNALLIISGAFGVFKTDAVREVGGYDASAIGEDMELVLHLHAHYRSLKKPYKIQFVPEATCWTEVPSTIHSLYVQRNRWQRGLIDSLRKNGDLLFHGAVGLIAIPYFVFVELLGPIVEILIWVFLFIAEERHLLGPKFWWEFVIVSLIISWVISFCSIAMERFYFTRYYKRRDYFSLVLGSIFEPFGYRQMTAVWRFVGFLDWMRGNKKWGKLKRRGFGPDIGINHG